MTERENAPSSAVIDHGKSSLGLLAPAFEYAVDAAQRSILFWDVMRQRGNQYREHLAEAVPHVLNYEAEFVIDGRTLERPVNYCLVRIIPPAGVEIDPTRAAVCRRRSARRAWPGYWRLQGRQRNRRRAQGRPSVLFHRLPAGSDAGPDHRGYRARRSGFPRKGHRAAPACRRQALRDRQLPGRLGGHDARRAFAPNCSARSSLPARRSPIGRACTANIRCATPAAFSAAAGSRRSPAISATANSTAPGLCRISRTKIRRTRSGPSNIISIPRSTPKPPRYLGFERWWGGHVNLNAEEIQFIVDELFVGNNLAAGKDPDLGRYGHRSRAISARRSWCSAPKGDNVTPPQQALGWILDLYEDVDEIRAYGQTIVYTIHETIGHLGYLCFRWRGAQSSTMSSRAISI